LMLLMTLSAMWWFEGALDPPSAHPGRLGKGQRLAASIRRWRGGRSEEIKTLDKVMPIFGPLANLTAYFGVFFMVAYEAHSPEQVKWGIALTLLPVAALFELLISMASAERFALPRMLSIGAVRTSALLLFPLTATAIPSLFWVGTDQTLFSTTWVKWGILLNWPGFIAALLAAIMVIAVQSPTSVSQRSFLANDGSTERTGPLSALVSMSHRLLLLVLAAIIVVLFLGGGAVPGLGHFFEPQIVEKGWGFFGVWSIKTLGIAGLIWWCARRIPRMQSIQLFRGIWLLLIPMALFGFGVAHVTVQALT